MVIFADKNTIEVRVYRFVAENCNVNEQQLNPKTEIVKDLRLVGDDAFEFIEAFAEEFSVKVGDFKFSDYFPTEGFNPLGVVASLFESKKEYKVVTVGMLVKAALDKEWIGED